MLNSLEGYTVVTADGFIIQCGNQGVVIVDSTNKKPVMKVSEVSDDEVTNLFIDYHEKAAILVYRSQPGPKQEGNVSDLEILVNNGDL